MTAQKLTQLEDYLAKCGMTTSEFNEIREPTTGLLTNLTSGKTSGGPKSKGEEFVEAVEVLLDHEETIHKPGEPHVSGI